MLISSSLLWTSYKEFLPCFLFLPCTTSSADLSRLRPLRDALEEEAEVLDMDVGISPFSDVLRPSLMERGSGSGGTGSCITMTSSLLCWPRCSLAKSKPFTLGACNWGEGAGASFRKRGVKKLKDIRLWIKGKWLTKKMHQSYNLKFTEVQDWVE